jgi:hypothetical protein
MLWDAPTIGDHSAGVAAIYFDATTNYNNIFLIYNNIIKIDLKAQSVFSFGFTSSTYHSSFRIYNNTVYSTASNSYYQNLFTLGTYVDTLDVKNNIFYMVAPSNIPTIKTLSAYSNTAKTFDYNLYYYSGSLGIDTTEILDDNGTTRNWGYWTKVYGQETHSYVGSATFANVATDSAGAYKLIVGSTGIDAGVSLASYFTTDYWGTTRPQPPGGTWDIGAYEYVPTGTFNTLTTSVSPSGGGTVSPSGTNSYSQNTIITLVATANSNYHFVEWDLGSVGTIDPGLLSSTSNMGNNSGATYSTAYLSINNNATYIAIFKLNAPGVPTLGQPLTGSTGLTVSPTLTWYASTNASSYNIKVDSTSKAMTHLITWQNTTNLSYTLSSLKNLHWYYWTVNAKNANGDSSAYAVVDSFQTLSGAPTLTIPVPSFPVGLSNQPLNLTLKWDNQAGATGYKVKVSTTSTFSNVIIGGDTTIVITTNSLPISLPSINTPYYWSVKAINTNYAENTTWCTQATFTTLTCH